jgi:CDGSH-type Zn-finger protein
MSEVKITVSKDGSLKVEGNVSLADAEGNALPTREGKPIYLCRCGHSANKPFCDSSHRRIEFDGTLADRS